MLLDKSSCALLRYVIALREPETIMAISRELQQSRRKIYYHLEKINASLPEGVLPIESLPRLGIVLDESQREACRDLLQTLDAYTYVMNMAERTQLMLVYIAVANERVTIEKLMELTEVSRNTVLNDLNEIRSQLAMGDYQMTLSVSKAQGYSLNCHPLSKIQYMQALLATLFSEGSKGFVQIVEDKLQEVIGEKDICSPIVRAYLVERVKDIEKELGKKINPQELESMLNILPYLLLSYRAMELDELERHIFLKEFAPVKERIEYRVAQQLQQDSAKAVGLVLDEIEVSVVAILLLSYRKDKDAHVASQDFADLRKDLDRFLDHFERHSSFELENRADLLHHLLAHCKALVVRKTYGIVSRNPMVAQIKAKYATLFSMTKRSARLLEDAWDVQLTEGDLAYLTVHLGGALRRGKGRKKEKQAVYLVCDEGVAIQRLLVKQCQHHLPDKAIQAVFTTEQFKSVEDLLEADFVISTSEGLETHLPLVRVHPILDLEDVLRIQHFSRYKTLLDDRHHFSLELDKLLSAYLSDAQVISEVKQRLHHLISSELLTGVSAVEVEEG